MRTHSATVIVACLLLAAVARPFALEQGGASRAPATWSFVDGVPLSQNECATVVGGDVRMSLNSNRTTLTVNVIDNEYEARLGRIAPKNVFEFDVHNRIVDTTQAPFMPATKDGRALAAAAATTTRPSQFPEGYWSITAITPRQDKYGPYMISTNAVGSVEVFMNNGAGNYTSVGYYSDLGYALHANTNPFNVSKSYGCPVMKQEDIAALAQILKADKAENANAVQKLLVPGFERPGQTVVPRAAAEPRGLRD